MALRYAGVKTMAIDSNFVGGSFPIKMGEHEFSALMLTDRDKADLTGYIQYKYIEVAKNASKENGDGAEILKFALASAVQVVWNTEEGMTIINTEEGILRIGWQMIRKKHPQIAFNDWKKLKADNSLDSIWTAYKHLHGLTGEPTDSEGTTIVNDKSE